MYILCYRTPVDGSEIRRTTWDSADFSPNRSPSSQGPSALRGTGAALAQGKPPTSSPSQKKGPCLGMSGRTPGAFLSACAVLGMGKVKQTHQKRGED